jgi:hypothetical protein
MRFRELASDAPIMTPLLEWPGDWAWGLPVLVVTVVFHVSVFMLIINLFISRPRRSRRRPWHFIVLVAIMALLAAIMHGLEAAAWAFLYVWLGALPNLSEAILYSLGAITSYGHASIFLEGHWRLLGAIEAVNGLLIFGLTTAFLFAAIHKAWPQED